MNHNFLTCALTVCIVVNGEKIQSHAVTFTLTTQCPMSNLSEIFSYTTIYSSFKWIEPLFFELSCTHTRMCTHTRTHMHIHTHTHTHMYTHTHTHTYTHTHAHTHTDRQEYSIVAVFRNYNLRNFA